MCVWCDNITKYINVNKSLLSTFEEICKKHNHEQHRDVILTCRKRRSYTKVITDGHCQQLTLEI